MMSHLAAFLFAVFLKMTRDLMEFCVLVIEIMNIVYALNHVARLILNFAVLIIVVNAHVLVMMKSRAYASLYLFVRYSLIKNAILAVAEI